jgi:DNA-binding MarR family transcriptional regulator
MDGLHEEDRLKDAAEKINPIFAPIGLVFKKMLWAFEQDVGLSPPKYFILELLAKGAGMSQGEIGQLSDVDPSRITRLAKQLEGEGLIERARDPKDNRVVRLHLTSEGRRVFEMASQRSEVFRSRIRRALSEAEQRELRRLLGKVAEVLVE